MLSDESLMNSKQTSAGSGISKRQVFVMAVACGGAVANLYYPQPLLNNIGAALGTGTAATGWIMTMAQIGYAAGLLLLVPIGDIMDRRRLVLSVLALSPIMLLLAGMAPNIWVLYAAELAIGLTSVVAQVLVPYAASLATDDQRGQVTGVVTSGLLLGILLSRTISGMLADLVGWRGVFFAGAAVMVVLALLLWRELPADQPRARMRYGELVRSVGRLLWENPVIRERSLYGGLIFASFSAFWTTVAFVLAQPPYQYSNTQIGLFGLIGAAGASMASVAGRLADRGTGRMATGVFTAAVLFSFFLLWLGGQSFIAMVAGVILLDVAVQALQVLNQSEIYRVAPDARNRANSAYMTVYFIGASVGSALGSSLYAAGGWTAVCLLGAGLTLAVLALWAFRSRRERHSEGGAEG